MKTSLNPIVVIPARLATTRFPNKPLADIHGKPMIVHVWRRAVEANIGPVLVAAGDQAIADAIAAAGGKVVMTNPNLPSGSDRVHQALESYDPEKNYNVIINVQGDLPTIEPRLIAAILDPFDTPEVDITTLAVQITQDRERTDPNVSEGGNCSEKGLSADWSGTLFQPCAGAVFTGWPAISSPRFVRLPARST